MLLPIGNIEESARCVLLRTLRQKSTRPEALVPASPLTGSDFDAEQDDEDAVDADDADEKDDAGDAGEKDEDRR
jgi:hypothetical protein